MWACPTLIIISDSQIITDHGSLFQNVSCFTPHFLSCSFVCHLSSSPSFGAPGYTSGGNCQIRKSALSLSLSLSQPLSPSLSSHPPLLPQLCTITQYLSVPPQQRWWNSADKPSNPNNWKQMQQAADNHSYDKDAHPESGPPSMICLSSSLWPRPEEFKIEPVKQFEKRPLSCFESCAPLWKVKMCKFMHISQRTEGKYPPARPCSLPLPWRRFLAVGRVLNLQQKQWLLPGPRSIPSNEQCVFTWDCLKHTLEGRNLLYSGNKDPTATGLEKGKTRSSKAQIRYFLKKYSLYIQSGI